MPPQPETATQVKAPLTGSIVDVVVGEGDEVSKGQVVVVIESMKMNNELRAPLDGVVAQAQAMCREFGFKSIKLKGGVFEPQIEVDSMLALRKAFGSDVPLRMDPNAIWSVEESIQVAKQISDLNNDYLEDPTWGLDGMQRVRERIDIPTATNTVVVNFEQLASCIRHKSVDVILLDTTFWGGLRQAYKAGLVCETFQWGIAVHSSGELGIQLATMLHLGVLLPNLRFAADAHYQAVGKRDEAEQTHQEEEGEEAEFADPATALTVRLRGRRTGQNSEILAAPVP